MKQLLVALLLLAMVLGLSSVSVAEEAPVAVEGISRLNISVFDLEKSVDFYKNTMELSEVATGSLTAENCKAMYGVDSAAQYVMLKNDVQSTLLALICFDVKPTVVSREGYNSWDYGYYDIAFRCADINAVHENLTAEGFVFSCDPYQYTTTWSGDTVFEAVVEEMNGVHLALINKTENTPAFEGNFRNFPDSVLVVSDMSVADKFYTEVLDCPKVFDMEMEKGLVDPIVGVLDTEYNTRIAMYIGSGNTPIIEILDFDAEGREMTTEGATVASNAGLFASSFQVDDLDARLTRANDAGFQTVYAPVEVEVAPYGTIRTATISGPDGSLVELFQVQ